MSEAIAIEWSWRLVLFLKKPLSSSCKCRSNSISYFIILAPSVIDHGRLHLWHQDSCCELVLEKPKRLHLGWWPVLSQLQSVLQWFSDCCGVLGRGSHSELLCSWRHLDQHFFMHYSTGFQRENFHFDEISPQFKASFFYWHISS